VSLVILLLQLPLPCLQSSTQRRLASNLHSSYLATRERQIRDVRSRAHLNNAFKSRSLINDHLGRQGSTQSTRLIREQVLKKESRQRKQMTQIASHRVDQMYYMQGSQSKLFLRHPVNTICSIQDQIRRKSLPPDLHRKTVIPTGCGNFDQRLIFITDT